MTRNTLQKGLLLCGICSPILYIFTDIIAGSLYPGYSFNAMAVSELFAIGAPTSLLVVILFSISSLLLLAFAPGIWRSPNSDRWNRVLAVMVSANALNSLILWIFFPMHMRGDPKTYTDTVHTILAINPFILVSILIAAARRTDWFRYYSIATILLLFIPAAISFSNISLLLAHQPTPWLGFTERISVYSHQIWHAVLALGFMQERRLKMKAPLPYIPSYSTINRTK